MGLLKVAKGEAVVDDSQSDGLDVSDSDSCLISMKISSPCRAPRRSPRRSTPSGTTRAILSSIPFTSASAGSTTLPAAESPEPPEPPEPPETLRTTSPSSTSTAPELDTAGSMGPKNRPPPKREANIGDLLTVAEKNELTLLVTTITDAVRSQIARSFDAASTSSSRDPGQPRSKPWNMLPSGLDMKSLGPDHKENLRPPRQEDQELGGEPGAMVARNEGDMLMPSLENMKKDVLSTYRRWQASVIKRVNEIVVSRDQPAQRTTTASTSTKTGPDPKAGSSNRANHKHGKPLAAATSNAANRSRVSVVHADAVLLQLYPGVPTSLHLLPTEKKRLLLHAMLLLVLSLESYMAYPRVLLLHLVSSLRLSPHDLAEDEVRVGASLSQLAKEICVEEPMQKRPEDGKSSRRWKAGPANGGGVQAAAAAAAAGLPEPLESAGVGSAQPGGNLGASAAAGLLGPMAENSLVIGALFGIYGARGAGKMMESYAKEIPDLGLRPLYESTEAEFHSAKEVGVEYRRLRVVIGVSGWLTHEDDVVGPWRTLGRQAEVYALKWEVESLLKMGGSLVTVAKSAAWSAAKKEIAARASKHPGYSPLSILKKEVALDGVPEALWPVSLLKISKIVDNTWSLCMVRADKAGLVLAETIMNRLQGERSITLIGYSLGARVVYACLMALAEKRALGVVENAVLMGTPAPSDSRVWSSLRSVVAGRLVNVYSEQDYMLGFMYRTSSVQFGVAGLQCIEGQLGIENVNVSSVVTGHLRYQYLTGTILDNLGWEDIDGTQVARDREAMSLFEEKLDIDGGSSSPGEPATAAAAHASITTTKGKGFARGRAPEVRQGRPKARSRK